MNKTHIRLTPQKVLSECVPVSAFIYFLAKLARDRLGEWSAQLHRVPNVSIIMRWREPYVEIHFYWIITQYQYNNKHNYLFISNEKNFQRIWSYCYDQEESLKRSATLETIANVHVFLIIPNHNPATSNTASSTALVYCCWCFTIYSKRSLNIQLLESNIWTKQWVIRVETFVRDIVQSCGVF